MEFLNRKPTPQPRKQKCRIKVSRKEGVTSYEASGCSNEEIKAFKEADNL